MEGFYEERAILMKEFQEELSYEFMENLDEGNGHLFLHGSCYDFAIVLKKYNPEYQIVCLYDCDALIHAYCMDTEGAFIDVRGKTKSSELFFEEFSDWYDYENPDETTKRATFSDVEEFKIFLTKNYHVSFESETETLVNAELIYKHYQNYYTQKRAS